MNVRTFLLSIRGLLWLLIPGKLSAQAILSPAEQEVAIGAEAGGFSRRGDA
jgi:hypothetical protein